MAQSAKPIPDGRHTVTPHLVVRNAPEAIAFYCKALGAEEISRSPGPDGRLMHAEIRLGDTPVFLCDEFPEHGGLSPLALNGSPVTMHLYVEDADAVFNRAVEAGATVAMPLANMFWGDRYGKIVDPFGHHWSVATHLEDLTPEQMRERMGSMDSMCKE